LGPDLYRSAQPPILRSCHDCAHLRYGNVNSNPDGNANGSSDDNIHGYSNGDVNDNPDGNPYRDTNTYGRSTFADIIASSKRHGDESTRSDRDCHGDGTYRDEHPGGPNHYAYADFHGHAASPDPDRDPCADCNSHGHKRTDSDGNHPAGNHNADCNADINGSCSDRHPDGAVEITGTWLHPG